MNREKSLKVTPLNLRHKIALEVAKKMQDIQIAEHPLRQLFWECTLRCDFHCRHCGSDCKTLPEKLAGNRPARQYHDMPFSDFARVLDSVARRMNPHEVFVIFSGGEPLMRDDLEECGAEVYRRGFPCGMVTNAFHLSDERLQSLLRSGIHSMTISLDGLEKDHDWMRGKQGSFQRVDHAIDMLINHGELVYDIVTCVNQRNYMKLPEIKEYLIAKGVKRWRVFSIFPMGRAAEDPMMHISDEQYRGMLNFIRHTRKEGRIRCDYGCEGFLGNYEGEVRNSLFACHAGINVGSVLSDGSISACTSIRANYQQGNIYEDDFMDVWENRFIPYRNREWMRKDECATCGYFRYCRGNGMHLRGIDGQLLLCHLKRLNNTKDQTKG